MKRCTLFILISTDELRSPGRRIIKNGISHFEEEMDAAFQISLVSVFLAPKSGPVGMFKDFKIQLLFNCLQGPLKLHVA